MKIQIPLISTVLALLVAGSFAAPSGITLYFGACDGSAVIPLNDKYFATAEDEHNTLRIYETHPSDPQKALPVWDQNFSDFLGVNKKDECDLEAGARIGNLLFWIGSHGTDGKGAVQEARQRLFATDLVTNVDGTFELKPHGIPYKHLIDDLSDAKFAKYNLAKAATLATKSPGGLNIEALCATPKGELLIGFRAPISAMGAMLIPLQNPSEICVNAGARAKLGDPIFLNLGGLGFRDMTRYGEKGYLILAGAFDSTANFALYFWDGDPTHPPKRLSVDFGDLRPEGIAVYADNLQKIQIFSDDGKQQPPGEAKCGDIDKSERRFQSAWIDLTIP